MPQIKIKKQISDPHILTSEFEYLKQDIYHLTYQNMFRLELTNSDIHDLIKKLQIKSNHKLGDIIFSSWGLEEHL